MQYFRANPIIFCSDFGKLDNLQKYIFSFWRNFRATVILLLFMSKCLTLAEYVRTKTYKFLLVLRTLDRVARHPIDTSWNFAYIHLPTTPVSCTAISQSYTKTYAMCYFHTQTDVNHKNEKDKLFLEYVFSLLSCWSVWENMH